LPNFVSPFPTTEKPCSKCGRWLPVEAFPLNRSAFRGRGSRCRECAREATRDWRTRNRERENAERRARYRREHPLPERPCVVCGSIFQGRPDAIVCGPECRRERKREQRQRLRFVA
jgi:predicted nucleic acid-binding Zn ribbon protein